ncbi:MAG: hypothetical protein JWQ63_676 [Mucilaginibacter sp.]|nr:hypothetical protein [Mucilaginibacter sp.]
MKTSKNTSKRWIEKIIPVCLLSVFLSSCLKTNNNNYYPPEALVTFIQASPDEPQLDFYLNNNKINLNAINYGDHFDYFRAYAGSRTANFYSTGSMNKLFSSTIQLNQNTNYSLFLANKAPQPEIVLLTDTINQPASGNASIRFVNLSPDAPAVDLAVQGGSTLVSNKSYKGYSSFIPVQANKNYVFQVLQAGSGTVLATLSNVNISSGSVYTIWFHGLSAATTATDQLSASIYTNAYFY